MSGLRRRRITKKQINASRRYNREKIDMECKECGYLVEQLDSDIKAVTCEYCVQRSVPAPEPPKSALKKNNGEHHPRGWHLKKRYVSPSGKVYSFGKEVTENDRLDSSPGGDMERKSSKTTKKTKKQVARKSGVVSTKKSRKKNVTGKKQSKH
jgi:hypothetical protein